jgi:hypothetical protein
MTDIRPISNLELNAEVIRIDRRREQQQPTPDGAELLFDVAAFLGRFIAYPSEQAHYAHTLWIAHTHMMDAWSTTPRGVPVGQH